MSTSEAETSDSNMDSPLSLRTESPYSSPSQQVPQLTTNISQMSWFGKSMPFNGKIPQLVIVEQPQNHFRFRYKSEMIGTHGCLLGKSSASSKSKTHPAVELKNHSGKALIRCTLARHDCPDEHPHKLLEDDQDRDVSSTVPHHGSYRIGFSGMGIIHTAKKDVPELLYKKYVQGLDGTAFHENKIRVQAEKDAKDMNLNIVRLKFSAHDLSTDEEICPPVFSEPIHNMKSASTNDLRICRMSRCYGKPKGFEDVFMFVEKVNKKNIQIRFYELENGVRVWSDTGKFLQSEVHHQYAIVFRTPPYRDLEITKDVNVFIELVRPSDGRTSEPREFTYRAGCTSNKKRKANSSYSSLESNSEYSFKHRMDEPSIPKFVLNPNPYGDYITDNEDIMAYNISLPKTSQVAPTSDFIMAEAMCTDHVMMNSVPGQLSPLLSQPNIPEAPVPILQLNSSELDRIVHIESEDKKQFLHIDFNDYFKQLNAPEELATTIDLLRASNNLVSDSAKPKNTSNVKTQQKNNNEYSALYAHEDGMEVKKLVREICEMIKNKSTNKKHMIRSKLERLFEIRLSNGDTFLHMTLMSNQPSLEYIVKLIHNMGVTNLLNLKNNDMLTVLHLAIMKDMPKLVNLLVSKGCNPMEGDSEGNNAVHYTVIHQSCLSELLKVIRDNNVTSDINAYNNEKQTALHLSVVYGSAESAAALLRHGARVDVCDIHARTPLHLAVYDDCSAVLRILLENNAATEIDAVDDNGYTALQIACDSELRNNTLEIIKILLEFKADPNQHEHFNNPAWKLAKDKPRVMELLRPYIEKRFISEVDIKSEPEDEYESAEEEWEAGAGGGGGGECLEGLARYEAAVCAALEEGGGWRALAAALRRGELLAWFAADAHPARKLLRHVKDCDNITSKSLEKLLTSIGELEAAAAIRKHL